MKHRKSVRCLKEKRTNTKLISIKWLTTKKYYDQHVVLSKTCVFKHNVLVFGSAGFEINLWCEYYPDLAAIRLNLALIYAN